MSTATAKFAGRGALICVKLLSHIGAASAVLTLLGTDPESAWADPELDLLQKFQRQNQKTALQVKQDVEENLARAATLSPGEPERALDILRQTRELLDAAEALPRAEKSVLARKVDDAFRYARERLESKLEAARVLAKLAKPVPEPEAQRLAMPTGPSAAAGKKLAVSPILFEPIMGLRTGAADTGVTAVVLPDRRWVRISFSGAFSYR